MPTPDLGALSIPVDRTRVVATFPTGETFTTTALTPETLNPLLQTLTCQLLGLDPLQDPQAYAKVRLSWPTEGQPGWSISDDVCFLRTTEEDDAYTRVRDRLLRPRDAASVTTIDTYVRVWRVHWSFYGPQAFDHARTLKSALLALDFAHDTLASASLSLVADIGASTRQPELFEGRWWERTDLTAKFNELVTETFAVSTLASAEVVLQTERGPVSDFTA